MRAPYQVLVMPFRLAVDHREEYAALRRGDDGRWQGIAGGGHVGEVSYSAARRETEEELGVSCGARYFALQSVASIPRVEFRAHMHWPADLYVVPEYSFAVDCSDLTVRLSSEHDEIVWGPYEVISARLAWDSNRVALWELHERQTKGELPEPLEFN